MITPAPDDRSPKRRLLDEQIAAEPLLPPPDLSPDATASPVEAHLVARRRPVVVAGADDDRTSALDHILEKLESSEQPATYGAVGGVMNVHHKLVMSGRPRNPRNSWVINKKTRFPTNYEPHEIHPALLQAVQEKGVIETPEDLEDWLAGRLEPAWDVDRADRATLRLDEGGAVRVGDGRITLDLVVEQYENGMTPEDVVRAYDALALADVYAVIAYYLRRRDKVTAYLKARAKENETLRATIEAERPQVSREELLARRPARYKADAPAGQ